MNIQHVATRIGRICAALTLTLALPVLAQTGPYPNKPIRVIVPFATGSATDIVARTVTEEMRNAMGQPFVVDDRPGANGFIGAEAVAKAAPDGYTLLVTATTTHSTNPSLFKKLPYDPVKDFVPIGGMVLPYYVLIVNNSVPVTNLQEFITWLRANGEKATYAYAGTVAQLAAADFVRRIGAKARGVPYKSSPQAMTELIGGQVTFIIEGITTALPQVKGNRVRGLAVTSPQRNPDMPAVPTMTEGGLPNFSAETWIGMFAPAGTPEAIVERLSTVLQNAVREPSLIQKITTCCSIQTFPSTRAQFTEYLAKDRALWAERIKTAGIEPE